MCRRGRYAQVHAPRKEQRKGRGDGVRKEDVEGRKEEKSTWWMVEGEFEEG